MKQQYIGIDIGGTNLRFALVDPTGAIFRRSRVSSGIEGGRAEFCGRLIAGINEMRSFADSQGAGIAGIGAGVPGLIGNDGYIHSSVNMRPLEGLNLAVYLEKQTGLMTVCGNDANLIALGEHVHGAGRQYASLMLITIGTGLGSGLILNNKLWSGAGGFAAEFGHVTVASEGIPCPCGNRGCLECYVSAGALVRYAHELLPPELIAALDGPLDAQKVADLAFQGEAGALAAFDRMGGWLGMALASLTNTLNLEAIIIGGGVSASFDLLLPSLTAEIKQRCFPQISAGCKIVKSKLGDDAGLLGGAALAAFTFNEGPPLALG